METVRIRDPGWKKVGSGIRDKHPGSATLLVRSSPALFFKFLFISITNFLLEFYGAENNNPSSYSEYVSYMRKLASFLTTRPPKNENNIHFLFNWHFAASQKGLKQLPSTLEDFYQQKCTDHNFPKTYGVE